MGESKRMYLIKETYLEEPHKGRIYLLTKGGYVLDYEGGGLYAFPEDCYQSERAAKSVCTRYQKKNDRMLASERAAIERRREQGKPEFSCSIYENVLYEPFEILKPSTNATTEVATAEGEENEKHEETSTAQ